MKDVNPVDANENVIKYNFRKPKEDIPTDVMFPASRNFPKKLEPKALADSLVDEFDSMVNSHDFKQDYIHHHNVDDDYNVSFSDTNRKITEKIVKQLSRLKEDSKRMKYYLDEMETD